MYLISRSSTKKPFQSRFITLLKNITEKKTASKGEFRYEKHFKYDAMQIFAIIFSVFQHSFFFMREHCITILLISFLVLSFFPHYPVLIFQYCRFCPILSISVSLIQFSLFLSSSVNFIQFS